MLFFPVQMDCRLAEFLELKLTMCVAAVTVVSRKCLVQSYQISADDSAVIEASFKKITNKL